MEVHRPSWHSGRVDFAGRAASSAWPSSTTCRSCRWCRSAARRRRSSCPAARAWRTPCASTGSSASRSCRSPSRLPWGLNVGDFLGHIPLPSKIVVEALPPIHLREEFGPEPDVDEVYEHVTRLMQETLDALQAERRLPVIG